MEYKFFNLNETNLYKFVIILTHINGKILLCKRTDSEKIGFCSGKMEQKEKPIDAAKRLIREQTGAVKFTTLPIFDCWISDEKTASNGMIFFSKITELGKLPQQGIEKIECFDEKNLPIKRLVNADFTLDLLEKYRKFILAKKAVGE
ncbi:MAG: NUDIX domain-containing protein [Oscillospiraceae bacterium]